MKKLFTFMLLFFAMPGFSSERQFDIELIVFKRSVNPEQVNESWPNEMPPIDLSNVGSLENSAYRQQKGVKVLPSEEYQLLDHVEKLKKHAGYQVLLHKVWRQGDQGKVAAPVFRLRAGRDYSKSFNQDGSEKGSFVNTGTGGITEQTIDNPLYELDGKLQVYVQHYLFLETMLDIKAPGVREIVIQDHNTELPETDTENTVQIGNLEEISPVVQEERFLKNFRMDQKRRMRSSETHYLDHPLMGIIVQVRRVSES